VCAARNGFAHRHRAICLSGAHRLQLNCVVHDGVRVRHNSVADGRDMLEKFNIPSATHISRETDLATLPKVTVDAREFSGSVSRKPVQLARACRRLQNAF
jgi:hypothetical protein